MKRVALMAVVCSLAACSAETGVDELSDGRSSEVKPYRYDDQLVVEGDILVDEQEMAKQAEGLSTQSLSTSFRIVAWPGKRVPYEVRGLNERGVAELNAAIAEYRNKLGIEFVPHARERAYVIFRVSSDPRACYSAIGKQLLRQPQYIDVTPDGGGCLIHEMGHALGLLHEQSRADRDRYLRVHLENVDRKYASQFDRYFLFVNVVGPYDYGSVMHYPPYAFTKNGQPTMTKPDGSTQGFGTNRYALSDGDVRTLQALYR